MRRPLALACMVLAAGCRTAVDSAPSAPRPPAAAPASKPELPDSLHWFRNSAERRALSLQAYRLATEQIEKAARGREAGSWAVILDADETVLDNSGYEKELLERGIAHTPELWSAWVARKASPVIPGAVAFVGRVHALGGRVAIVSNRTEAECPDTEGNLKNVGIPCDAILCKSEDRSEKGPRFERVVKGDAFPDGRPVDVLMWVGDNILDFPDLTQAIRTGPEDAFAPFGTRYIVLPNPMYGSWEKNPKE
jgi:5'-nucleotidase (lipoprotein e(P4) family)